MKKRRGREAATSPLEASDLLLAVIFRPPPRPGGAFAQVTAFLGVGWWVGGHGRVPWWLAAAQAAIRTSDRGFRLGFLGSLWAVCRRRVMMKPAANDVAQSKMMPGRRVRVGGSSPRMVRMRSMMYLASSRRVWATAVAASAARMVQMSGFRCVMSAAHLLLVARDCITTCMRIHAHRDVIALRHVMQLHLILII